MADFKVSFWNLKNLFDTPASPIAADLEFTPEQRSTEEVFDVTPIESPDIRGIDCSLIYSADVFDGPAEADI